MKTVELTALRSDGRQSIMHAVLPGHKNGYKLASGQSWREHIIKCISFWLPLSVESAKNNPRSSDSTQQKAQLFPVSQLEGVKSTMANRQYSKCSYQGRRW